MSPTLPVAEILARLSRLYGEPPERRLYDPLSELVLTILSQNTSDANSGRAFRSLLSTFDSWEGVAQAPVEEIARAIAMGGLARVKAPRLKRVLQEIKQSRDRLDLSFLGDMPIPEAQAWLRCLPGVGPKTAACVLLFGLGKPVLPVDTHVYRVARRLGLLPPKTSAEKAHEVLQALVPAEEVYRFHRLLIEHGRRLCKAQRPRCPACPLRDGCPAGKVTSHNPRFSDKPVAL